MSLILSKSLVLWDIKNQLNLCSLTLLRRWGGSDFFHPITEIRIQNVPASFTKKIITIVYLPTGCFRCYTTGKRGLNYPYYSTSSIIVSWGGNVGRHFHGHSRIVLLLLSLQNADRPECNNLLRCVIKKQNNNHHILITFSLIHIGGQHMLLAA